MYEFLAALPAILGILGFVVYLLLRSSGKGDPETLRIVEKLRAQHPEGFATKSKLTSTQLYGLLQRNQTLQREVGNQDFVLLGQALRQQFVKSLVVYIICALLFLVGVALFVYQVNRPAPTSLSNLQVLSSESTSGGLLVDLDALRVTWQADGRASDIVVYLENLDTGQRTRGLLTRSDAGDVSLKHDDYTSILSERRFGQSNRVRVVAQSGERAFYSREFLVQVGLTVLAVAFDKSVKIAAIIDNSLVPGYNFEARLVVPMKGVVDYHSLGGSISGGQQEYPIESTSMYDWASAKIAYLGPDDRRLVRYDIVYE
ncbi:hypothetical protein A5320_05685 [Rheinheimera sp. SA_1]|uniref:hypothetical protein n=1 Tax=Rheinheimera sp. SA_1 TaxID=1827365 RepID=UPI0007FD846D|nr:hypothetical protein [Rheinheimera sp. SA_1]OBP16856.1 hypothetical protein A5320_05685 [Rheinheimera sp. SA_1]